MTLKLHNTLTGRKEPFAPADPKRVTMYVCGPTVYSYAHIGNARPVVAFDVLYRLLRRIYGEGHVVYARNFTDVDDKIIAAARETGAPIAAITEKFAQIYVDDMAALGALEPNLAPKATEHIEEMLALIQSLLDGGFAYTAEGHVLFDISKFDDYGKLSRLDRDAIIEGARVEVAPYKRDAADFVLWKPSNDDEPGWDSPWGRGRPGWHLECSAMIDKTLGRTIDIHGGGQDLRFPHHENEIAQSACAHGGAPLARFWVHNGFVNMGDEKMSKSLGNILLVHELIKKWPGEAIRWALLSAHYRQPVAWTEDLIGQAKRSLDRLYGYLRPARGVPADKSVEPSAVIAALEDDLNTPEAFAALFAAGKRLGEEKDDAARARAKGELLAGGALLGFLGQDPEDWFKQGGAGDVDEADIDRLLIERAEARKAKDFARADQIRDELAAQGIIIEDGPSGATWRRG